MKQHDAKVHKPMSDREQLLKLHFALATHNADIKHVCDLLRRNQVKRAVRVLDNTTSDLGRTLLTIADRQGMPKTLLRKLAPKMKVYAK